MGILLIYLLLRIGLAFSSNFGYVEWSDNDKDSETKTPNNRDPQYHPTLFNKPVTERTVVAHKIEEDLPRVVTAFLHTGDSATLEHVNCSRRYELSSLRGGSQVASHYSLHSVLDTMAHATNFLNMLLQANRSREQTVRGDIQWYHALVRSMLEGDPKIHRAVVSFHAESSTPGPHVLLQATRTDTDIVLQDLSSSAAAHRLKNRTPDSEWYNEFRDRRKAHGFRRGVSRDARGTQEGYLLDKDQIKWSAPYLECENGNFVPFWLLTLSAGFYGLRANSAPEFRGVVRVDVNLQDVDIDQCSSSGWFAGTHRCNLTTMECKPINGHGFVLDKYKCQCKRGFYHPSRVALNGFSSKERGSHREESLEVSGGKCLPCREGCPFCRDNRPCLATEDGSLRLAIASFQGLCMLVDFIGMLAVYHFRRNKRIRASGLILLEAILCGALLLYFPVMIMYFHPSVFRCILLRWVRLLGFATVYGTVTLKLYRVLKVFLSRTAQRIPYMTSCRVLRLLGIILLVVGWFLVAWTSAVVQHPDWQRTLIDVGSTPEGLQFSTCLQDRWDYMMAVAEFLFLLWAVYLCYAVRSVPSAFHEPRYMAVAIYNELLISAIFHIIRFSLASGLHPDWMLTLFFVHTHLTVTVTLGLMFVPKFFSSGTHTSRDDIATEAYEDELDMGRSGSYLNSSITSAWSEHSLDPEDIREELKKLYTQLEVYKRKKMLANNPHLQKKRSSKKGLGRSLMRRITEIPESMSRQCSREDRDRDGSEHGSNRSTLRRSHHLDARTREDSLRNKMFPVKRSHSYDHVCDQNGDTTPSANTSTEKLEAPPPNTEASLLDTLMGRKAKKATPQETPKQVQPAESAESVPLVCKSVSAHNLTADKKPIQLRTTIMQKSLSVIASARERTLGLTGKTQSVEDASKKGQKAKDGRLSEVDESPECYPPKMIISQSVEYTKTPCKMGIMKQREVSGSQPSICSEPGRSKELYDLSEVCPWELEDLPTPSSSEGKTQKHVSISIAPCETTYPTTAAHSGSGSGSGSSSSKSGRSQQKQRGSAGQSPAASRRRSRDKAGGETRDEMPRKPRSPLNLVPNPEVCPWDMEEPMGKVREGAGLSPDRSGRKKSVTPTDGKPKVLHSDHSKSTGSLLQPPALMVEICPWDYDAPPPTSPKQDRALSPTYHSRPKDSSHSKRKGSCSSRGKDRDREEDEGRTRRPSKSKERRSSSSKGSDRRRVSQSSDSGQVVAATSSGRRRSSTREAGLTESRRAEICPWETEQTVPDDAAATTKDGASTSVSTARDKPSHPNPAGKLKSVNMEDVCPWDF